MSDCYGCVCGRAHTHEEDEARAEKAEAALAEMTEAFDRVCAERDDLRAKLAAAEHNVQHWHSLETKAQSERRTAEEELVGVRVKLSDERDAAVARGDSLQTAVKLLEFEKAEAVARAERAEADAKHWTREKDQARVARLKEALQAVMADVGDTWETMKDDGWNCQECGLRGKTFAAVRAVLEEK